MYDLGDFFQWTFGILEVLGNGPNLIFTVLIILGLAGWIMRQKRYLKEDKAAGRII